MDMQLAIEYINDMPVLICSPYEQYTASYNLDPVTLYAYTRKRMCKIKVTDMHASAVYYWKPLTPDQLCA